MPTKILFVDDEPNIIDALKRMLFTMDKEWEMNFVLSGHEALKILQLNEMDVIITDMRMPEMDGAQLLSAVREKYPHLIRIVLSGHSDDEMALRSTTVAHQYLTKPCSSENLILTIKRAIQLREYLNDKNLIDLVHGLKQLPSLPELYIKLDEEIKSEKVSLQKVGDIMSKDIMMSAKILQLVNSAFFGLPSKVTNPLQAVNLLGLNVIKSLVLYVKVFSSGNSFNHSFLTINQLWKHSILVANMAKRIIKNEVGDRIMESDAYVAGLLHDIGKIIIYSDKNLAPQLNNYTKNNECTFTEAEYKLLKNSHSEVGAYLLGIWNLPDNIIEAVALHNNSGLMDFDLIDVSSSVFIANSLILGTETRLNFLTEKFGADKVSQWFNYLSEFSSEKTADRIN
ncbi:MAG: HDOD domain-containing protein [Bacteroidetes bacterium]|nr:HDOD domain-containing protein [Bacteroidota bacterium]